jgi:hypothetical protein
MSEPPGRVIRAYWPPQVRPRPVGQIVGRMNEVRPVAELIKALLQEGTTHSPGSTGCASKAEPKRFLPAFMGNDCLIEQAEVWRDTGAGGR